MPNDANTLNIVLGVIASVIAGIMLPTTIRAFEYFVSKLFGRAKHAGLGGTYDCEYHVHWKPEGENVIFERIFIFRFGRKYYGYIINNLSDSRYRKLDKPGLRLQGELFVDRYLIGWWSHPLPGDNSRGAFNIKIDLSGQVHEGQWNGESSTYRRILEGRWIWRKQPSVRYGLSRLVVELILGRQL